MTLFDNIGTDPDVLRARIAEAEAEKARYDALGQDAKLTYRRNKLLAEGTHPTTRRRLISALSEEERIVKALAGVPANATCNDCRFCVTESYHTRSYVKCRAVELTHGPGSDTRRKWPACTKFEGKR